MRYFRNKFSGDNDPTDAPGTSAETIVPVNLGLTWTSGVPDPCLLQSENRAFLAFFLNVFDSSNDAAAIGIVEWHACRGAILGSPNDEASAGHRLWEHGLREVGYYSAGEVVNSRWIRHMALVNSVHMYHNASRFSGLRHFVLGFHDSTFEVVCDGFASYETTDSWGSVIARLAERILDLKPVGFDVVATDRDVPRP